jgi:hypothetical protein
MTNSNSAAVAERRTEINRKQNTTTYATVMIVKRWMNNLYHKYWIKKLVCGIIPSACVSKNLRDLHQIGDISVVLLSASDGAGAAWVAIRLAP